MPPIPATVLEVDETDQVWAWMGALRDAQAPTVAAVLRQYGIQETPERLAFEGMSSVWGTSRHIVRASLLPLVDVTAESYVPNLAHTVPTLALLDSVAGPMLLQPRLPGHTVSHLDWDHDTKLAGCYQLAELGDAIDDCFITSGLLPPPIGQWQAATLPQAGYDILAARAERWSALGGDADQLRRIAKILEEDRPFTLDGPQVVVHGDVGYHNVLWHSPNDWWLIDWEAIHVAHPVIDAMGMHYTEDRWAEYAVAYVQARAGCEDLAANDIVDHLRVLYLGKALANTIFWLEAGERYDLNPHADWLYDWINRALNDLETPAC